MLLRSIRLVNFRGVAELHARDLRDAGVQAVGLPAGAAPGVVAEAVRFALFGRTADPASPLSDGAGYTWVEVAFAADDDRPVSVFRGLDRRGSWQVSLREDGGMRITSGADDVAARLDEVLGAPSAAAERALFPAARDDALRAPAAAVAAPVATPGPSAADVETARGEAHDAADALRRALRTRALRGAALADFDRLTDVEARLRRDRAAVTAEIDGIAQERDRVRTRLRRTNEYRDLAAHARRVAPPPVRRPRGPSRWVEFALGACAAGLLALLVLPVTAGVVRGDPVARSVTGLGFVVASASYLWVASKRHGGGRFVGSVYAPSPETTPAQPPGEPLASIRARFADLGDPDDPRLADDLRARLSRLDEQASPLQTRLEALDEALARTAADSTAAARSLHVDAAPSAVAERGLAEGERPQDAAVRVASLADAIHQACVERDALAAQGVPDAVDAARWAADALRGLGAMCGDEVSAERALADAGVSGDGTVGDDADADAVAERLRTAADHLVAGRAAGPSAPAPAAPAGPPDVASAADDAVASLTGGRFSRIVRDASGDLAAVPAAGGDAVAWSDLDAATAGRLEFALRVRAGEALLREAGGSAAAAPRAVVLDALPPGIASDEEAARIAADLAPRITQVVVGRPGEARAAPPAAARRAPRRR